MAKVASKMKRVSDIVSMLEKGMERKEILQKFSKNCKVSARTLDNEIKEAKKVLEERNRHKEAVRLEQTTQTLKEAVNEAVISDLELEAILCTIATNNIEVEEIVKGNAVLRGVSPLEQIAAIDKIFRKRGAYANTKVELGGINGKPIETTSTITLTKEEIVQISKDLEEKV